MARPIRKIRAGSQVWYRAEVRDLSDDTHPLFTPASPVLITVKTPMGATAVAAVAMTSAGVGLVTYAQQTATTDPTGVYTVSLKIVNSSTTVYTTWEDAFELVP